MPVIFPLAPPAIVRRNSFCIRMQKLLHSYAMPLTNCDVRKTKVGLAC